MTVLQNRFRLKHHLHSIATYKFYEQLLLNIILVASWTKTRDDGQSLWTNDK